MVVIYIASTDLGSVKRTSRIIGPFLRWFKPDISDDAIRAVQAFVRKSGHVTEYAILAALIWRSRRSLRGRPREWNWKEAWIIVPICTLYAITDEVHQAFVSSRQGSPWDVLLDTFGAFLGLLVIWMIGRWRKYWQLDNAPEVSKLARS